jgi:hypothetical protein
MGDSAKSGRMQKPYEISSMKNSRNSSLKEKETLSSTSTSFHINRVVVVQEDVSAFALSLLKGFLDGLMFRASGGLVYAHLYLINSYE